MIVARRRFHLTFPASVASEPLLYRLHADFGLVPNIRRASFDEEGGWVIVDLEGSEADTERCLEWLAEQGVNVDRIDDDR
jgi:L-aspartate semialdehyde sulfurtransferase ferredoxin